MTTIINVKSKGENALGVGYSFKINEPEQPIKELTYLTPAGNYYNDYEEGFKRGATISACGLMANYSAATAATAVTKLGALATLGGVSATTAKHIDLMHKLLPIIHLIQDIAMPISIIVASWACIEWIIGSPGWKQKIKGAIIGFCAIYIIPFAFEAVGGALSGL